LPNIPIYVKRRKLVIKILYLRGNSSFPLALYRRVKMEINSTYYNHYNLSYRYSCEKPKLPAWKEEYMQKTETIHSSNSNPKDDFFKAATILEETYYSLRVANRAKYKTVDELERALIDKYCFQSSIYYNIYTETEREAMYDNELNMTLFGCLPGGGDFRDPHIKGTVHGTRPEEKQAYNRTMVMKQINNIFKREGIKDLIGNKNLMFTIDPFSYKLGVSGTEDTTLINKIEEALNKDRNSIELFYHILKGTSKNIPTSVKDKFSLMNTLCKGLCSKRRWFL
jgi:hypothetical protein